MAAIKPEENDDELMARLAAGDASALDGIVRRYGAAMLRFLVVQVGDPELSQDLLQDVFVAVFEARDRYEPRGQFRGWLYQIARNLVRKSRRDLATFSRHASNLGDLMSRGWIVLPDEAAEKREEAARLLTALGELDEDDRALVELHLLEGRTFRQIAAEMEISVSTAKARLDKTLDVLRRRVAGS